MKVAFLTLGCKVNQYETNGMIQQFQERGYEVTEFEDVADIYIINTCTVTNMSDRKSRQFLRQAKKNNSDSIVVAVGCYVQVSKDELEALPEIDLALGTNDTPTYNTNNIPNDNVGILKQGIKDMLTLVRSKNPNATILWAYGMMATNIS